MSAISATSQQYDNGGPNDLDSPNEVSCLSVNCNRIKEGFIRVVKAIGYIAMTIIFVTVGSGLVSAALVLAAAAFSVIAPIAAIGVAVIGAKSLLEGHTMAETSAKISNLLAFMRPPNPQRAVQ